jgi:hypothetical protein
LREWLQKWCPDASKFAVFLVKKEKSVLNIRSTRTSGAAQEKRGARQPTREDFNDFVESAQF